MMDEPPRTIKYMGSGKLLSTPPKSGLSGLTFPSLSPNLLYVKIRSIPPSQENPDVH